MPLPCGSPLRGALHAFIFVPDKFVTIQILALHAMVRGKRQLCVTLVQQLTPCAVLCLMAHLPLCIRQALRRAVWLVMKPEDVRSIHAANTGQRIFFNTIFLSNWLHLLNPHASQRIQRILVNIYPLCQIY